MQKLSEFFFRERMLTAVFEMVLSVFFDSLGNRVVRSVNGDPCRKPGLLPILNSVRRHPPSLQA
jgi:hypothetical protein